MGCLCFVTTEENEILTKILFNESDLKENNGRKKRVFNFNKFIFLF